MVPDGWANLAQRYQKLNQKNDFLSKLNQIVPWEEFRPVLEQLDHKPRKSNAGRKPFDRVLMFKLLILQQLHNLSDEQLEYQVNDRLSFMQFLAIISLVNYLFTQEPVVRVQRGSGRTKPPGVSPAH